MATNSQRDSSSRSGKGSGSKGGSGRPKSASDRSSGQKGRSGSSKGGSGSSSGQKGRSGSTHGTARSSGAGTSRSGASKSSSGTSKAGTGASKPSGGQRRSQYTATTRDVERQRREESSQRRRDLQGAAVNLPNWVIENLARVTPKDRVGAALEALGAASEALADGKYQSAVKHGRRAKALAPNDATVRETIGIAAYRLGDWSGALTELRAYRRMAGETTHLPIEMDIHRAMGRDRDVENTWAELQKRGGHGLVMNEGVVVYASYLIDKGRAEEAWKIANPGRTTAEPNEAHLRRYFVAARAAAALGDRTTAKRLSDAIVLADPGFPGWEQLESEIAAIPT